MAAASIAVAAPASSQVLEQPRPEASRAAPVIDRAERMHRRLAAIRGRKDPRHAAQRRMRLAGPEARAGHGSKRHPLACRSGGRKLRSTSFDQSTGPSTSPMMRNPSTMLSSALVSISPRLQ